ncbi:MAG: thiosulfate oxidation carrier protein SoxY [Thiomonas sp.]|uniref:Sulfur oxidation protein SoxY n=1 Tax=mine drainage metagenome TaxID=410659 RepID=E6PWC0_9ZZZZ
MNQSRRQVMQLGAGATVVGLAASAGLLPVTAQAADAPGWDPKLFEAKTLDEIAKVLGATATESTDVSIVGPDIAENGAVVPVGIKSTAAGVSMLGIVVQKNPTALVATFSTKDGAEPNFATRIKMAQTSHVYAVAKAGDKLLFSKKEIKVTLGGCGG